MTWVLIVAIVLVLIAAFLGPVPRCSECGQVIRRRDLMAHYNLEHAGDRHDPHTERNQP